ncbi:MAG TPA: potassium channel family protein [Microbacterium sp.]|nr:potassium channel family protein [Microbacterium sp.]
MPDVPRPNLIERELSRFLRERVSVRTAARVIVTTTLAIVIVGGVAITLLDRGEYSNIWEGMWWAIQTVTTVGYGDVTPKSAAGRLVAAALMLEGVAFVAVVTAAITSNFVERARAQRGVDEATHQDLTAQRVDTQLQDITERLARLERMLSEQSPGAGGR